MEGTEFYDVTFAIEDDKEISIVLELNPETSAVVVIDFPVSLQFTSPFTNSRNGKKQII